MSASVSCNDIVDAVNVRLNYADGGFTTSTATTLAQVQAMVAESARSLSARVSAEEWGDEFLGSWSATTTTADVPYIILDPAIFGNVLRIKRVQWQKSTTQIMPLMKAGIDDVDSMGVGSISWDQMAPKYRRHANRIYFYPKSPAAYDVRFYYTKALDLATSVSTAVDMWPGWMDYIALDVCAKIHEKEGKDFTSFINRREECWQTIVRSNSGSDDWGVDQIRDLNPLYNGGYDPYRGV